MITVNLELGSKRKGQFKHTGGESPLTNPEYVLCNFDADPTHPGDYPSLPENPGRDLNRKHYDE